MRSGMQIPPAVAGIVIVLVLVVAGFLIYRVTGPRGRVQLSPDQVKQMQQMMGQRPPLSGGMGGAPQVSQPPMVTRPATGGK